MFAHMEDVRIDNRKAPMQRAELHRVDETLIDHLANVDAAFPRSTI
jgi:hypothetical protein